MAVGIKKVQSSEPAKTGTSNGSGNNNLKVVRFHPKEARELVFVNDEFITCTLHKEVKLVIKPNVNDHDIMVSAVEQLVKDAKKIIQMLKLDDVIEYPVEGLPVLEAGRSFVVHSILIPYTDAQDMAIKNLNSLCRNSSDEVRFFKTRIKNVARVAVDKAKCLDENVFMKGFAVYSHEHAEAVEDRKNYIKAGTYIEDYVGMEKFRVSRFNRSNLNFNKVNIVNGEDQRSPISVFTIPFKKSFGLIQYEIDDQCDPKEGFRVRINRASISLKMRTDESGVKKISTGIYVTANSDEKNVKRFHHIFLNKDKGLVICEDEYVSFDPKSLEAGMFRKELEAIDKMIFSDLERTDVGEDVENEATNEVAEPQVVEEPVEVNSDADEEERKTETRETKKRTKKSTKKTDVVEEVTEEKSEEPAFNDVGTLVDEVE